MATTPTVYVICDKNCRFEGMTKEQILTAIMQAVEGGEIKDVDAGFITTIKTINGKPLKFFVGEKNAYDELTDEEKNNLFAIITNDETKAGILAAIEELTKTTGELAEGVVEIRETLNAFKSGDETVKEAEHATTAGGLGSKLYMIYATVADTSGQTNFNFNFLYKNKNAPAVTSYKTLKDYFFAAIAANKRIPATGFDADGIVTAVYHNGTNLFITVAVMQDGKYVLNNVNIDTTYTISSISGLIYKETVELY